MEQSLQLQTRIDQAKESPLFYKVFALVGAGMMLDAADVYMASAINSTMISAKFATLTQGSFFLSAGFLGLFIGSLVAAFLGDFYGRRRAYQLNLLLFGVFTLLGSLAPNIYILIGLRLVAAIGLGAEAVTGYAVINEFAPVKSRGKWSGAMAVIANLGAPVGLLLSTFLIAPFGWRAMFITIGIFAILLWIARRHFPESPRWLITQGRTAEAATIIHQLERNGSYESSSTTDNVASSQISKARGLFVGIVAVSAALVCQYTFTSWAPTLLVRQGINIVHSIGFSALMMVGAPCGALLGGLLVDRIGRKWTITPSFLLVAILGLFYAHQSTASGTVITGFLLTMMMYVLIASILSVYVSELFETSFRFRGVGYANAVGKLLSTLTPYIVALILTTFNPSFIFYIIAAVAVFAALVVGLFGPETKQRVIH